MQRVSSDDGIVRSGDNEPQTFMTTTSDPREFLRAVSKLDADGVVFLSRLAVELAKHSGDELLLARLRKIKRSDYPTRRQWRAALMTTVKRCPLPRRSPAVAREHVASRV
jgi:hypothetical protein